MKLSMSMIESRLAGYRTESNIVHDSCTIQGVRFFSEHRPEPSRDYVFLGPASDYLKDPQYNDALLVSSGSSYIVCWGSEYEGLLNDVLGAFEFFNDIEQKVRIAAAVHEPLSVLVDAIGQAYCDPLLVFGIDGLFLAGTHTDALSEPAFPTEVLEHGTLDADAFSGIFYDETGAILHDLSDKPTTTYNEEGAVSVSMYLYQDGEPVGFVMCIPTMNDSTNLAICLESLFADSMAQAQEFTHGQSPHLSSHLAFAQVARGAEVSNESLDRLLDAVGGSAPLHVACVKSLAVRNHTQRLLLAGEVEASASNCVATEYEDAVLFLVGGNQTKAVLDQVARRSDPKMLVAGVSMPIASVESIESAVRQAMFACTVSADPGVRYCQNVALNYLIGVMGADAAAHDLLHPAILTLEAYDTKNGTELLSTLRTYVACECNQMETAKKLVVHLNTLKYRLGRIRDLTGLEFHNHEDMFYLELSLRLMES